MLFMVNFSKILCIALFVLSSIIATLFFKGINKCILTEYKRVNFENSKIGYCYIL